MLCWAGWNCIRIAGSIMPIILWIGTGRFVCISEKREPLNRFEESDDTRIKLGHSQFELFILIFCDFVTALSFQICLRIKIGEKRFCSLNHFGDKLKQFNRNLFRNCGVRTYSIQYLRNCEPQHINPHLCDTVRINCVRCAIIRLIVLFVSK